jgi:hypothetical protein
MTVASLSHVFAWRERPERTDMQACSRIWGPVTSEEAAAVGCVRAAVSVVIMCAIAPHVIEGALQCVPVELLPRADDTRDELAARLGASAFLDDAHVLNGGNGKRGACGQKRKRLNETSYPAPRRKSWSVVVRPATPDEDGEMVQRLFNYSAYGRTAQDVRCAALPLPVFELGVQLWLAAMPYLSVESRRNPPTHCQLLLYYVLFASAMGRHRDNYTVRHLKAMLDGESSAGSTQNTAAGMENSQRIGSEVLVYTEGTAPMDFILSFPRADGLTDGISSYVKTSVFTVRLGRGTLMVFKDLDDQFFCHEAEFERHVLEAADAAGYRMCFVFRWCVSVKHFRGPPECSFKSAVPPPENVVDV